MKYKLTMNKSKMYKLLKGYGIFHLPKMVDCEYRSNGGYYWLNWYEDNYTCRRMKAVLCIFCGEIRLCVTDLDINMDLYKDKLDPDSMIADGMCVEVAA